MKNQPYISFALVIITLSVRAQHIPIDTSTWDIRAQSYRIESYRGQEAIYLHGGTMTLKDVEFDDGVIEFDLFLKEEQAFPGVLFRRNQESGDAELFYVRPHQSGNPDANQAAAVINNITPWQLYYGEKYSFRYEYKYNDWTHIKLLVKDDKAQVFLDFSEEPHLSWYLFSDSKRGRVALRGGNRSGFHIANIKVSEESPELSKFNPIDRDPIEGLIQEWEISDMFEEKLLDDLNNLDVVLRERKWQGKISVEEGVAANISRIQNVRDGTKRNTVLARVIIDSSEDQLKLFEFGYSDRVVAVLNGKPIYLGTNKWRSRDYRYLGTIGLFDGIYLDLKEGKNELVLAVSEDFGGWLVTGRISDKEGIKVE